MASAAVVSVSMGVMKPVLEKLTTLMGDEYKKIKGLRKEVTFLQSELSDMDALLEKIDVADELDPQGKKWKKDIIEMSYDIEDRIDDFMRHIGEPDGKVGILQKACKFLRTFKDRRRLANEIQEIKNRVMEAGERRKRHTFDQCISVTTPVVVDPRISALYKDTTSLVGIDAQKAELVEWAIDKGQRWNLMAIVGFGGLGKTTLANEVYREVGGKFNCMAFVSVSQKPEMIGLLNSMLSQFGLRTYSHACQVQDPINELRGHLHDKRYFIVVDLWDMRDWNTIQYAIPQNNRFSRVVITTRNENLARSCCENHGWVHSMKALSESDSRKLFFNRIFGSEDACPRELTKPSSEILKKCGGLPLAIITMAGMLACQPKRSEGWWESVQHSLATNTADKSKYEDMMYILDLSYKSLPRQLKACFLYLGSYPEDHEICRIDLVRRWVVEGFVSSSGEQDIWDVAESYFSELVNRSMIQPIYRDHYYTLGGVYGCRVHDMLLELIVRRCREDNFLTLVNDSHAALEAHDKAIRRLTLVGIRGAEYCKAAMTAVGNLSQIRTLAMLGVSSWMPPLLEFKVVRVLFLDVRGMSINLTCVNQLSQLRYLTIRGYGSSILAPRQIKGLRVLETLDLYETSSPGIEIVDAPRLSHLIMPGRMRLFDWIGRFRLLHTLCGFTLPMDSLESIISLGELTALSYLVLYTPEWCTQPLAWMEALGASLEKLHNLRQLAVINDFSAPGYVAWRADALSSLSTPFRNLERLDLGDWTFSRVPRWICHFENLSWLWIGAKQIIQEDVETIGTQLPSLLRLSLRIPGIPTGRIVIGASTGFTAVKCFEFNCDRVSYLAFDAGAMPSLRELCLVFDPVEWDRAAPDGLKHLQSLEKIEVLRAIYSYATAPSGTEEAEEHVLIEGVLQEATGALPTRPALIVRGAGLAPRLTEEEAWAAKHGMEQALDSVDHPGGGSSGI